MKFSVLISVAAAACLLSGCAPGVLPGASALYPGVDARGNTPPPIDELAQAQADYRARNFGLASQLFQKVAAREPRNADAWLGLGATHDELGRFDLADQDYAEVAKLTGTTAALLNDRGYSYLLRGDYARAQRLLLQAESLAPDNAFIARNIRLLNEDRVAPSDARNKGAPT